MKKKLYSSALVAGVAVAAVVAILPAGAASADSANTTVTFALTGGSLNISAPATADLGSAATTATTVSGPLGTVTVNDSRGMLAAVWTATVSTTDFTTGSGSNTASISGANVTYTPGLAKGNALTVPTPGLLNLPLPVMTATAVGNNTASWTPTLTVLLPGSGAVAGTYTGTVTHSVS